MSSKLPISSANATRHDIIVLTMRDQELDLENDLDEDMITEISKESAWPGWKWGYMARINSTEKSCRFRTEA